MCVFCRAKRLPPRGKLSPQVTDEGGRSRGSPLPGNSGSSALIRSLRATFPLGEGFAYINSSNIAFCTTIPAGVRRNTSPSHTAYPCPTHCRIKTRCAAVNRPPRRSYAGMLLGHGTRDKSLHVVGPEPPHIAHTAVGGRADAPIIAAVPVQKIVPPLVARAGKVADLILPVACGLELLHGIQVKICCRVSVGQTRGRIAVKRRARLYL